VNLHIKPGTTNIFMGPSGSGKSTLLNLLERFAIPDRGFISIDGKPLSQYDTAYLRSHIASLDQEPDLFNMSVQENIAFADPERENNLPDVMGAGKIANISDFIHASSKNYDTVLDNEKLSGGQKQRMALARAVYSRSPIIIMDEPTSALDKASVNTFISNMHYFTGRTILIVTHDYALLDRISGANIFIVDNQSVKPISEYGGVNKYKQRLLN
jgi:ABC-type bacteriocin/lantibiotic exporter with double-glycine peptidase domain